MSEFDLSINLIFAFFGAIVSAIIAPLGDRLVNVFFEEHKKPKNINTVLLLLMSANALWVLGELFGMLFRTGKYSELVIGFVFFVLSSFLLFSACSYLSKIESDRINEVTSLSLQFLILGNIFWVIAEFSEMFISYFCEGSIANIVRVVITIGSILFFALGLIKSWQRMGLFNQKDDKEKAKFYIKHLTNEEILKSIDYDIVCAFVKKNEKDNHK